jgi:hypothetical protein
MATKPKAPPPVQIPYTPSEADILRQLGFGMKDDGRGR